MKKYIGTKEIKAMPISKSEAEVALNRKFTGATGGEEGYLVEYQDGYVSWSPKDTFEETYKIADTYLDRMRIEYADVKERILKLHAFMMSEEFRELDKDKQETLENQCSAMTDYIVILGQRIDDAKMEQEAKMEHDAKMEQEASVAAAE